MPRIKHPENNHRPPKKKKWLEQAIIVLNEDINSLIFDDEELIKEVNAKLEKKDQIAIITFKTWKCNSSKEINSGDPTEIEFKKYLEDARRHQKKSLFDRMLDNQNAKSWNRFAWIIERKFDEWNLKQKVEQKTQTEDYQINIIYEDQDVDGNKLE